MELPKVDVATPCPSLVNRVQIGDLGEEWPGIFCKGVQRETVDDHRAQLGWAR